MIFYRLMYGVSGAIVTEGRKTVAEMLSFSNACWTYAEPYGIEYLIASLSRINFRAIGVEVGIVNQAFSQK